MLRFLLKKAEEHHMELPEEVAFFIAQRLRTNVRELEGALNRGKRCKTSKVVTLILILSVTH